MTNKDHETREGRRGFLKMASAGTVAGAAVALVGGEQAQAALSDADKAASGYRETAHVKKVYDLSRF